MNEPKETASNVLGTPLETCCTNPLTGFYRNGKCHTGPGDHGLHVVCVKVTEAFLLFGRSRGNDLMTPNPQFQFPGLKPGDCWCVCLNRWVEALQAGCAPPVKLESTHVSALEFVDLDVLKEHALDESEDDAGSGKRWWYCSFSFFRRLCSSCFQSPKAWGSTSFPFLIADSAGLGSSNQ